MKALVYGGPGQKSRAEAPDPQIFKAGDAIVQIATTTICGTDLHILRGDVPAVEPGRILGHEGVGTVTEVGSSVTGLVAGDRVIALDQILDAYDTFSRAAETHALKVILSRKPDP